MQTTVTTSVDMRRIGLGTVQFGLDYGVSNRDGKTPKEEAARILKEAADLGVQTLDTAAGYGESEAVLGETLPSGHNFEVVTKTVQLNRPQIDPEDADILQGAFVKSLKRLGQMSVYGLMAHSADDLINDSGRFLWRKMAEFRRNGLAAKIGASVYTASQIDRLLDRYDIDIIQLPLNIFDQRLLCSGHLQQLKRHGVEIHVRSVFLQGLLLMAPDELTQRFVTIKDSLGDLRREFARQNISALEGALGFVLSIPEVDRAVIGVCSIQQLREIYSAIGGRTARPDIDWSRFALSDEKVLNPANWPKE